MATAERARRAWNWGGGLLASALALLGACSEPVRHQPARRWEAPGALAKQRLRGLREREAPIRSSFSPRQQLPWIDASGADPYRIVPLGSGRGFVGILRGAKALVTLGPDLSELRRIHLEQAPTSLCISPTSWAWVGSRYSSGIQRVGLSPTAGNLPSTQLPLAAGGTADLACGADGLVHVLPADGSELLTLDAAGQVLTRQPALPGGLRLRRRGKYLLESSLFERSVRVLTLGPRGAPLRELARIRHDGPIWAFDAVERGSELLVAVAGVEDKPLVRARGEFENIDSFVWLYRVGSRLEQLAALNVGEQGLVVPKAVGLFATAHGVTLTALAAGSGKWLRATWSGELSHEPVLETQPMPPGVSDAVFESPHLVSYASPLFDAWIRLDSSGAQLTRVDPTTRPEPQLRLGEALFFTELMAPHNTSQGPHSRFSCETCHFEGGIDGRAHHTGRADVSVVTKPLFGLANNRPHFSRALDPDLSAVSHNEFRVAGAGSGKDSWFTLSTSRFAWLHELGIARGELPPLELRAALLSFLYAFSHAPNPRASGRKRFSALEAEGAGAFRDHCQSCHAPRLLSDDAASSTPFTDWEELIFARKSPLVWARGDYEKTGILPYVHERGTRITSLRGLLLKPRYFSNGSSADLASVLARFRHDAGGRAQHAAEGEVGLVALSLPTQRALLAFLQLL